MPNPTEILFTSFSATKRFNKTFSFKVFANSSFEIPFFTSIVPKLRVTGSSVLKAFALIKIGLSSGISTLFCSEPKVPLRIVNLVLPGAILSFTLCEPNLVPEPSPKVNLSNNSKLDPKVSSPSSALSPIKILWPIVFNESGKLIVLSFVFPIKACSAIVSKPSGRTILVKFFFPAIAPLPICFTATPLISFGTTTSSAVPLYFLIVPLLASK